MLNKHRCLLSNSFLSEKELMKELINIQKSKDKTREKDRMRKAK